MNGNMQHQGKFIVLYGANNLGKSTQMKLLVQKLIQDNIKAIELKYPVYTIPSGEKINQELRGKVRNLDDTDLQKLFAKNRKDYEPTLKDMLKKGYWVIAEDYTGTGIAWGVTNGISRSLLETINKDLLVEDLSILFDGERFTSGIEKNHRNEEGGNWERARKVHLELAKRYGWNIVNANQKPEDVLEDIRSIIKAQFSI
jgi:dTMP kinase